MIHTLPTHASVRDPTEFFCTPPGVTRRVANATPLTPRSPNAAASSCGPKPLKSKGEKRKTPPASKGKKPKKARHEYKPVPSQYEVMTTARLFSDGHIATGNFSYNHPQFAKEADAFNGVTIGGKRVWQRQPSGPSTLHNNVTIIDHFSSLAPFLGPLEKLCKLRDSTDRLFLKQRAQQYITSGRRHRDGRNGLWRMCVTVHNPGAPPGFKRLEVGVADARVAKGGDAINPWQLKADNLLREHGAPATFVLDFDPIDPNTFIDDVARIAEGTADKVKAGVGVSAYVCPRTEEQIGKSCASEKMRAYNKQREVDDPDGYKAG
ncbi:unnamed protein product [Ectocarpus sp. CCAP 1310/34]|nr:unnamed protein product [Ectocarpus sp. CCAP 1310/34]